MLVPSSSTLLSDLSIPDQREKERKKKKWTQTKQQQNICIMANTNTIWQQAAHTTYQLSSSFLRTTLNVSGKLDQHDQEKWI